MAATANASSLQLSSTAVYGSFRTSDFTFLGVSKPPPFPYQKLKTSAAIRCQSTSTDEPKAKRNLLDNASNLLTNFLSGGSLGSMPVAEGAVSDLFGQPLFFSLYDWFLEHGSVYKLAFGPKAFVVVSDPIVARHILRENAFSFDKGVLADILEPIMGKGLIPADLDTWKQRRRVIAPGFHALYLEAMVKVFTDCSERSTLKFENLLDGEHSCGGEAIELDLEAEFSSLALDIIGLGVFNYDFGSITKESPVIKAVYGTLFEAEHRSTFYIPYWKIPLARWVVPRQRKFQYDLKIINDCLDGLIRNAKESREEADVEKLQQRDYLNIKDASLLRFLVDMRGADVDDRQLRDDLMTMLIAGHETTAAVLTWAACPQCKTRYKRIKGCPRVEGDEEEDGADDLENEFDIANHDRRDPHHIAAAMLSARLNISRGSQPHVSGISTPAELDAASVASEIPLLTYGQEDVGISSDKHALIIPPFMSRGKRVHPMPIPDPSMTLPPRPMDPKKDLAVYGYGTVAWKERMEEWKKKQNEKLQVVKHEGINGDEFEDPDLPMMDEGRQPLSRKLPIPSSKINPYRLIILLRLAILGLFLHYRILHPVNDAYVLWLISVICEIWFAVSWILDQFPKWYPIERETYLDRLSLRYEKEGKPSELASVDIFVSTVDPMKEPPLITANTVLSILSVDYPVDKVACYVSDDGAAMLTFEALSETSEFARKWVPFCKKFTIEPRAPEWYFAQKVDYLRDKVDPTFIRERRAMKREYEEFKVRINGLVAMAQKVPEEGWTMQDGTPWPGNNVRDHPGMIQVFLGHDGVRDIEGNELPRLIYVSREKRPGFDHHKKAGAMNALVRVSAIISNAPFLLNVDCDHYINNSKALREAMCFMMDPISGKKICYVQFPQRFDGIDRHDRYSNRNVVFFDINMKGLDGIQGPIYVGTGCVFRRQALYGYDAPVKKKPPRKTCNCLPKWCCCCCCRSKKRNRKAKSNDKKKNNKEVSKQIHALENIEEGIEGIDNEKSSLMPQIKFEKKFGQSPVFIASTLMEDGGVPKGATTASLLKEAIHVISCGYEDKSDWGKEVGWIYGSVTEDILTGFKMHCHGWRSVYCIPKRPAFKGSAPINLSDRLHQVLRWALGSVEIFLSRHCPIWYGYGCGLKSLERFSYIASVVYPLTSIPLLIYCTLPAVCLLTGKFIVPEISNYASILFMSLFVVIAVTSILEMQWGGVGIHDWWRNEQFWVIGGVSSHLFALFQGLLKVLAGVNTNFMVTSKGGDDGEFSELYIFKWTSLLIPPMTLLLINIIGVIVGISDAISNGYDSWGPLFGRLFFAFWVIVHLYPFLKGLMGKQDRLPTIIVVWSILLASIFSLLWARVNPFISKGGIVLEVCGLNCD